MTSTFVFALVELFCRPPLFLFLDSGVVSYPDVEGDSLSRSIDEILFKSRLLDARPALAQGSVTLTRTRLVPVKHKDKST